MDKHQDIRQNTDAADDSLKWKPVSTEHVVQDKWIDFAGRHRFLPLL